MMRLTIQRENGSRDEAVLLAAASDRMRIVLRGVADTMELTKQDDCWRDERGLRVEIEAVLAVDFEERPRALAAGHLA